MDPIHPTADISRILRTAAWIWPGYLALLMGIDATIYAGGPGFVLGQYYRLNALAALIFLALSYWPGLPQKLKNLYIPIMLGLIAGAPIAISRIWIPQLPRGPMSNIEGITLRLLPVLFIGLIITAWRYPWPVVALFSVATAALEIGIFGLLPPPTEPSAGHALLFITLVRTISFLVVGYFISQLMQRLQIQQTELTLANTRLRQSAATLEQLTLSRERNRLARELHDTLAHSLSALSVQLETVKAYWEVEPETARRLLDQALAATRSGLNETRRALKALRASPLDDLGLLLALRQLAESAAERGKLNLHLSLPGQLPTLSPEIEQCLYRITQEAAANVVAHAHAKNLTISLQVRAASLELQIADDGLGMDLDQAAQSGHFGLSGMRERAAGVGAHFEVSSQPGSGTCLKLILERNPHAN